MKFRKKPVVIEAFQMTLERRWDNREWPDWLNQAWNKNLEEVGSLQIDRIGDKTGERLLIVTLEGVHLISWNDWIIQGIKGELYACKPDIFELTYEELK